MSLRNDIPSPAITTTGMTTTMHSTPRFNSAPTRYDPDELVSALADHFRASFIDTPTADLHPLARGALEREGPLSVVGLARQLVGLRFGPGAEDDYPMRNVRAALTTSDFPSIIEQTMRGISRARSSELLDDLLAFSVPIEVQDYREQSFSIVDLGQGPFPSDETMRDFHGIKPRFTGERVSLRSLYARLILAEQTIVNDDRQFLPSSVAAFQDSCHRAELARVAELLEANGALEDGEPLFSADRGNVLTGSFANLLQQGARLLRTQKTESGAPLDARLHCVICTPGVELELLERIALLPDARRPRLVSLPWLTDQNSFYATASPDHAPVLGRVRMRGSASSAVSFSGTGPAVLRDRDGRVQEFPGIGVDMQHSVGWSILSAVGIVKLTQG